MKEWDGVSKLEAGMICDIILNSTFVDELHKYSEVVYISNDYVVWLDPTTGKEYGSKRKFVSIRHIKSQEQIEREEAFAEMRKDLEGYHVTGGAIETLIDKGWRKIK